MKCGTWQPPRLTGLDVLVVIISLWTQVVVRSWDYSTGEDRISSSLTLIEDAFPLEVWGLILASLALGLAVGILFRVHLMVWASHSLLCLIYFILMIGMLIAILDGSPFPWDGIRGVTLLLTPAVLHGVIAIRTGPSSLDSGSVEVTEAVIKEDG